MPNVLHLLSTISPRMGVNFLLNVSVRGLMVIVAAGLISLLLKRANASTRHTIWSFAVISLLALPMLTLALPEWKVRVLPAARPAAVQVRQSFEVQPIPDPAIEVTEMRTVPMVENSRLGDSAAAATAIVNGIEPLDAVRPTRLQLPSMTSTNHRPLSGGLQALSHSAVSALYRNCDSWLIAIWALGLFAVLMRLGGAMQRVRRISSDAEPVIDLHWLNDAELIRSEMGLKRNVRLLSSREIDIPQTFGVSRPGVLVPASYAKWSADRRRVVLLHELSHVKRWDCLTNLMAQIACAVYWFNPLVWIAVKRTRTESERSCDDMVISSGTRASDYARHLLEIARSLRGSEYSAAAAIMIARPSQLESRLVSILDPLIIRRRRPGTTGAIAIILCALLLPLTIVHPAVRAATQATKSSARKTNPARSQKTPSQASTATPASEVPDAANVPEAAAVPGDLDVATTPAMAGVPVPTGIAPEAAIASSTLDVDVAVATAVAPAAAQADSPAISAKSREENAAAIAALKEALHDSDPQIRREAIMALAQAGDKSTVETFVELLNDKDPAIREKAVWVLATRGGANAAVKIAAALKDSDERVRAQAAWGLGIQRGPDNVEQLIGALKDSSLRVQRQAVWALGIVGDERSVQPLTAELHNSDARIREQAAWALGLKGNGNAVEPLIGALKDENAGVRAQAAWGLGLRHSKQAVDPLIGALKDSDPRVRKQAAWSLGMIGDSRAIDALKIALKDNDTGVRRQAVWALGMLLTRAGEADVDVDNVHVNVAPRARVHTAVRTRPAPQPHPAVSDDN